MPDEKSEDTMTISFSGVPVALLEKIDERAKQLDRPRSWVIREMLEASLAERKARKPGQLQAA